MVDVVQPKTEPLTRRCAVVKMTDSFELDARLAEPTVDASFDAPSQDDTSQAPQPEVHNGFKLLGLAPELIAAVADLGYTQPTTVQAKAIPMAMHDDSQQLNDLMVSSQTGSGKTAAFLLPVLHTLIAQMHAQAKKEADEWAAVVAAAEAKGEPAPKRPRRKDPTNPRNFKAATPGALILCPTRELAQQVAHDAIGLVSHCRGLRIANVVGGMPYQLQIAKLQNANLVVATPGRLLDLQRSMQIKLDQVQFLVVDEADRMLDLGFADDLAEVNQLTIKRHQTMMFSATFAPRIQQLATRVMREPKRVQIDSPQEKHNNIKQILHWADNASHKRRMLDHLLRDTSIDQAIVFASTQIECDGLANDLQQDGFSAVALHGALSQGLRNRRLMALRQGQVQILVATDVAARGIDVPTITHVFNYGLPMKSEDYTHRIGRTGRAGRDGLAVTLAEFRDKRKIFDIEAYTRQPFKAEVIPGLEPTQRLERGRDFAPRKGGGKFDGRRGNGNGGGGFGGGFGGRGRNEPRGFEGRGFEGRGFEGRGDQRHEGRADARFEGRAEKRFDDRKPFADDRQGFAAKPFGKPAASKFGDRKQRGPRQVGFEAGRTPFDKPARSAGKPSSGFDAAKKRTPKPRVAR